VFLWLDVFSLGNPVMRLSLILVICVLAPLTARADGYFESGITLYAKCTDVSAAEMAYCKGYIAAIADWMRHENAVVERCISAHFPAGADSQQLRDVVVEFLASDKEVRKQPAEFLVLLALSKKFTCPK
jgi:hypothetical protein